MQQPPQWSQRSHLSQNAPLTLRGVLRRAARTTTLLTGVLALLLLALPNTAPAFNLAATRYLCSGYASCQTAGYGNGGYQNVSSTQYWRMYGGHNCTNYVAYRLVQSGMPNTRPWDGSGNASNWGVAMASRTDQTPRVGAVAWYRAGVAPAGSSGHVAYVEEVISDTEIIVSEDYWGGDFHWRRVVKTASGWPSGFIHFNDVAVEPVTAPTIDGSPTVGTPLEVATGAWTPAPTSVTVRWLADGVAIPGANTVNYTPTPDVKGKTLTAEVTAALAGYASGRAAITTAPVSPGTLQPTALPTIEGVPEVGQALTLSSAAWSPQPATTETAWYADGVVIPGATGQSLVLTRGQIDRRITATVAGKIYGYRKASASTPETAPVLAKPVKVTSPFVIKGTPRVAGVLAAHGGQVQPSSASADYTWLRDGQRIFKATNQTYTVRPKDVGRSLSVVVSLSRDYFRTTTETIAVSETVKAVPVLLVRPEVRGGRVAVDVRVKAPGAPRPSGTITLRVGTKTVEAQVADGRARLAVRDLPPGTTRLVVGYAGTDLIEAAVARSRIKVLSGRQ